MSTETLEPETKATEPAKKESFIKHAAVYGFGTLATQAISILLLPLYTQILPVAEFGALNLIKRFGEVINRCLMVDGIRQATLNFWGMGDEKTRSTIAPTVSFFVYSSWIVSTITLLIFAVPISTYLGLGATPYVLPLGVIAFLFSASTYMPLALMQARLESLQFVVATLSIALLQFAVAVTTVAVVGWGIWGVILAMAVAYVGVGLPLTIRELLIAGRIKPDWKQLGELIRFALPFIPTGVFFFMLMGGDQIFLARIAGTETVGLYGLGHRIAMVIPLLTITPLTQVWSAWMYTAYKEENASEIMGKAITRILLVYITAAVGLTLLKTEILTVLAAEEYLGAIHVIVPIACANFFMIFANLMDSALWVTRRTNRKPIIAGTSAVVMTVLYATIIPLFHAEGKAEIGAAYATIAGLVAHAIFTYIATRNIFKIDFEFGRLLVAVLIAGACCVAGNWRGDGLELVPFKLAMFGAWLSIIWFGGLLSSEEKTLVWGHILGLRNRLLPRG